MPPRRSSHLKHVPLQHPSVMESMEAKLKRLRPSPTEDGSTAPAASASVPDGTQAFCKRASKPPTPSMFTRSDAPVVRNVRRGSASEAISSFHSAGEIALVDDLIKDRTAKSSYASAASLLSTWHRFHHEAFDAPAAASSVYQLPSAASLSLAPSSSEGGTGPSITMSRQSKASTSKPASVGHSSMPIRPDWFPAALAEA